MQLNRDISAGWLPFLTASHDRAAAAKRCRSSARASPAIDIV
jgi:hypothetical protein